MFSYQALICACSCSCFKWSRSWITPLCTLWHKLVRLLSTVSFTVNPHSHSSASVWEGRRASASQAAAVRHRTVPAIPCRRLFLVSERRNCGGAVQLSELEQKQEKKEKAPPEPVATVSMISPIYHSFSLFFASPDPTVLFATFLPDIFMSRSGYISKSSVKIFCCLKCSFLADTFSSGTFRVQRTSVTGVLFSDTDSTKTVTQSSRSCFQYRQ